MRRGARARRERPPRTYLEPARELPVFAEVDVLVVGGGPAGCAAAVGAARLGADVLLLERYGHLGGLSTGGLVIWIDRMTDWDGRQVIAGFAADILDRLPPDARGGRRSTRLGLEGPDAECLLGPASGLLSQHGHLVAADRPGVAQTGVAAHGAGPGRSAVLSLLGGGADRRRTPGAGCRLREQGRPPGDLRQGGGRFDRRRRHVRSSRVPNIASDVDEKSMHHSINVAWLWGGVDMQRWIAFRTQEPQEFTRISDLGRQTLGELDRPYVSWRNDVALFLGPRMTGYSAIDVEDLTDVEIESRRWMVDLLAFYRAHMPGFADAWIMQTAPQIGVRHSRRLTGVKPVLREAWQAGVYHPDEIGVSPSLSPAFASVSVPYGSLVPVELDGLLAPGRHMASDASSHTFMREIPQCWLTGQAAGVAAALAAGAGVQPRQVDVAHLQHELRNAGRLPAPADRNAGARPSGLKSRPCVLRRRPESPVASSSGIRRTAGRRRRRAPTTCCAHPQPPGAR